MFEDLDDLEAARAESDKKAAEIADAEKAAEKERRKKASEERRASANPALPAAIAPATVPTPAVAPADHAASTPAKIELKKRWEIVGGGDKGGIIVREEFSTGSELLPQRLSTGAIVEEIELKGERLHYRLDGTGTGPPDGWVSIRLSGKELAVPLIQMRPVEALDTEARCASELAKTPVVFTPMTLEKFQANNTKLGPGKIYGIEFPFDGAGLQKMGITWLTKAFHAAGSIPVDNKVKVLKNVKEYVGGGNCAKLTFDVEYETEASNLHTQLFAKVPWPHEGKTKSDRMTSSLYQSGSELCEIDTSRLLESRLPFPIPRYYFGDCSDETSNWILITERVPFGATIGPMRFDPAYDKMKDWELQGNAQEYYYLLIRKGAKMAGMDKAATLAARVVMDSFFPSGFRPQADWGMKPESSGLPASEFKMKLKMGVDFVSGTGKALFPAACTTPEFVAKYRKVLATINAYTAESNWWCSRNPDYVAWCHGNLNVDNVYFWRDADNVLDVGVLDWGGASSGSVGAKLWWWLYCCEYDFLNEHLGSMLECFITEYENNGGPRLEKEELRWQFILAALNQAVGLLGAVPQIYRMCSKKEWPTITDRKDPRISLNVDGKNTLRVYIGTFINICNMIHDWDIEKQLDKWVDEITEITKIPKKTVTID